MHCKQKLGYNRWTVCQNKQTNKLTNKSKKNNK